MGNTLTIKYGREQLYIGELDQDKEIEVAIGYDEVRTVWLSLSDANDLITHLARQLNSASEPIKLLTNSQ